MIMCACVCFAGTAWTARITSPAPAVPAVSAIHDAGPEVALYTLFHAFEQRDPGGWVDGLSVDYFFDSDDPDFHSAHPKGFGREDELAFATHLFREPPFRAGRRLPVATNVSELIGPMHVRIIAGDRTHATALVEHYVVGLTFDDGSGASLGATRNQFDLELQDGRWWITRWLEHVEVAGEPDSDAVVATRPGVTDAASRPRLALAIHADPAANRIVCSLTLPRAGGSLELYDAMGRRMLHRNLDRLAAGRGTFTITAPGIPSGIYWAQVRQGGESVSARVSWIQ
jgi:hypothetical protein